MQHQILINVIIFVAYVLNLPLNTLRSHSRSQRAGKWSLIMAHDRRPIYRAPTYIAVPMLGPHQPRYIGLTLYVVDYKVSANWDVIFPVYYLDGLAQNCSNSIANALELLQSCANSSIWWLTSTCHVQVSNKGCQGGCWISTKSHLLSWAGVCW